MRPALIGFGTWSGIVFALVGLASLAVAAVVRFAAPPRPANRLLAATLAAHGVYQVFLGAFSASRRGLGIFSAGAQDWLYLVAVEAATVSAAAYLLFVGVALESRWTRWLRRQTVPAVLLGVLVVHAVVWLSLGDRVFAGGREWSLSYYLGGVASVVALVASLRLLRHTRPGTPERRQALAFLIAFGARNLLLLRVFLQAVAEDVFGVVLLFGPVSWYTDWNYDLWQEVVLDAVFLSVLSYAVLTGQLVTLDARIKAAIQQAGVVTIISVIFISFTEGVEALVGFESLAMSILAAVLISLLFQPIHALAARTAGRLVPGPDSVRAMDAGKRAAVYREQATIAWSDGEVTAKERRMLDRLRDLLGLEAEACTALEDDVRASSDKP